MKFVDTLVAMLPPRIVQLSLLSLLTVLAPLGGQDEAPRPEPAKSLTPGLSDQDVKKRLGGPPVRIARQVLSHRSIEQWHYAAPHHVRLSFECERGHKPTLRRVEPITPPNR